MAHARPYLRARREHHHRPARVPLSHSATTHEPARSQAGTCVLHRLGSASQISVSSRGDAETVGSRSRHTHTGLGGHADVRLPTVRHSHADRLMTDSCALTVQGTRTAEYE